MSELTITSFPLTNYHPVGNGATARLRIWFGNDFVTKEGAMIIGGPPRSSRFHQDVPCTVDINTSILTVPDFTLPTTNDSSVRNTRATGLLYDSGGAFVDYLFASWIIPEQLEPITSMAALNAYNSAPNRPPAPGYPTTDQILTLIREGLQTEVVHGTFSVNAVPRAIADNVLADGVITDDGLDVRAQTLGYVQLGDYDPDSSGNGSRMELSDTFGLAKLLAGNDTKNSYAGMVATCEPADPQVRIQTTGQTHLWGITQETRIGDAENDGNGMQIRIYNHDLDQQMISYGVRNNAPDDTQIFAEEVCWFLDQNSGKLKARLRLDDGSFATWEGAYTPD